MPHSSTKAVPAKGLVKCDQKARRVPGWAQAARMPTPVSIDERTTRMAPVFVSTVTSAPSWGGWLRMNTNTRMANSTHRPAMPPKTISQLVACRRAASGARASSWPAWPTSPVNWLISGPRWVGNQVAMRRSTPGNTAASPAPRSVRAKIATPTLGEKARVSCPSAMSTMPIAMMGRAP